MKKIILLLFCVPLLLASTCEDDDQIFCTTEAVAALNISVSLGESSSFATDGITVVATDGDYSETLVVNDATSAIFVGAYERQGNYIITVSKDGYQTYTSEIIPITRDECHVIPEQIHVILVPN